MLVADHEPFERFKNLRDLVKKHELELIESELHLAPDLLLLSPKEVAEGGPEANYPTTGTDSRSFSEYLDRLSLDLETQIEAACSDVETRRSALDNDVQELLGEIGRQLSLFLDGLSSLELLDTRIEEVRRTKDQEAIARSSDACLAEKTFQQLVEKRTQICSDQATVAESIARYSIKHIKERSTTLQNRWKTKKALEEELKSLAKLEREQLHDSIHLDSNSWSWLEPILTCRAWGRTSEGRCSEGEIEAIETRAKSEFDATRPLDNVGLQFGQKIAGRSLEVDNVTLENSFPGDTQPRSYHGATPPQWPNEALRRASIAFETLLRVTRNFILRSSPSESSNEPSKPSPLDSAISFLEQRRSDYGSLERMHSAVTTQVAGNLACALDPARTSSCSGPSKPSTIMEVADTATATTAAATAVPALDFLRNTAGTPSFGQGCVAGFSGEAASHQNNPSVIGLSTNHYANSVLLLSRTLLPHGTFASDPAKALGSSGNACCGANLPEVTRAAAAFIQSFEPAVANAKVADEPSRKDEVMESPLDQSTSVAELIFHQQHAEAGDIASQAPVDTPVIARSCAARPSGPRLVPRIGVSRRPPYPRLD